MELPDPFWRDARQPYAAVAPNDKRPAAVYRIYNTDNLTIYIGSAFDPLARIRFHFSTQPWGHFIDSWSADWYIGRHTADAVEAALIEAERPMFNVRGTELHGLVSSGRVPGISFGGLATYTHRTYKGEGK